VDSPDIPLTLPLFTSQEVAELFNNTDSPLKIEELSSSGHHYATQQAGSVMEPEPTVSRNLRSAKHVPMDVVPGHYNFRLSFEQKEKYAKNHPSCFSASHNMLIVKAEHPITFKMETSADMRLLWVTVVAVYDAPEHHEIPVVNCLNHGGGSKQFITCDNPEAKDMRMGERACIRVPLRDLRDVSNHSGTALIQNLVFNCRSSCTTDSQTHGINSRKLALVFTLEESTGSILGRSKVFLKVSVSPGRDIQNLMKPPSASKKRRRTDSGVAGHAAKPKAVGGKYNVVCHHKRTYECLVALADRYDVLDDPELYLETLTGSQGSMPASGEKGRSGTYTLESWLARYHLEQYTMVIESGGYTTPQKLQSLKCADLDRLQITDKAHRHLLQHAITSLGLKKFIKDQENKVLN